jgi:hypothetical protein
VLLTVTLPWDDSVMLPPLPAVPPAVDSAPVLKAWPATALLTLMLPAVPPAPVPTALPVLAVSAPKLTAPLVALLTELPARRRRHWSPSQPPLLAVWRQSV